MPSAGQHFNSIQVSAVAATPHPRKGAVSAMLAAQNPPDPPLKSVAEFVAKVISALPPWLAATVVIGLLVIVAVAWAAPRVLRALDVRRVVKKASQHISSETGALDALRITRPPQRRGPTLRNRRGQDPDSRP